MSDRGEDVIAHVLEKNVSEIGDDANFVTGFFRAHPYKVFGLVAGFEEEFNIEMDEDKSLK